jgi:protein-S-isoprenylcysteine O-methyltransferase Ste14
VAAIVAAVGAVTVIAGIWGLVVQAGRGGVMGSLAAWVVIAFGLLLVGGGGWLTVLAMKQRGA